ILMPKYRREFAGSRRARAKRCREGFSRTRESVSRERGSPSRSYFPRDSSMVGIKSSMDMTRPRLNGMKSSVI
ncbi:MAG: hypothetical protein LBD64_00945, partial [Odoribacteraceae bacterium]|nr:hypothetical protein [Odoribacteraceae bacterium]